MASTTRYKTAKLSQLSVFYREAGDPKNPTVLLLHGYPTSSHMFRNLIPRLASDAHVVAPDLPAFGNTESPTDGSFEYTFGSLALVIEELVAHLRLEKYYIYVMDYGAPTGFRLMLAQPDRVLGIIVQNGNAYEEGLTSAWSDIRAYWQDRSPENEKKLAPLMTLDFTKLQYTEGASDLSKLSPDAWQHDFSFLQVPGHDKIQLDLFYDYRTNLLLYPEIQEAFRQHQFPMLIVWGKGDFFFGVEGAKAYLRDLPEAELHLLDGSHFALEEYTDEIAELMQRFIKSTS